MNLDIKVDLCDSDSTSKNINIKYLITSSVSLFNKGDIKDTFEKMYILFAFTETHSIIWEALKKNVIVMRSLVSCPILL